MVQDSNSEHQLLLPTANWCPIFAFRTSQRAGPDTSPTAMATCPPPTLLLALVPPTLRALAAAAAAVAPADVPTTLPPLLLPPPQLLPPPLPLLLLLILLLLLLPPMLLAAPAAADLSALPPPQCEHRENVARPAEQLSDQRDWPVRVNPQTPTRFYTFLIMLICRSDAFLRSCSICTRGLIANRGWF